ncbi:MAG: 50S ribosomal protein L10 [Candidatus Omnitrophica bacterium]|nr:50S ribosomal protein L10 [Candidatus Omnitrophota bacterium]
MNRESKIKLTDYLTKEFNESKIIILAEFSKLDVKEMGFIRRNIKELSCNIRVVKNNLVKKAFQSLAKYELCKYLENPNIIIWSKTGDESEVIKALAKFSKSSGKVNVKAGIIEGKSIEKSLIEQISRLPSKKVLQATVISCIIFPVRSLIFNIQYPVSRLILTLKTMSKKIEEGAK